MTPPPGLPHPIDALDRVARQLGATQLVSLEPDSVKRAARRRERLDDFGDPAFEAPLALLLRSLDEDADLHFLGRLHLRNVVIRALQTRLRLTRRLSEQPELAQGPARMPIVVCGLPRTGTTFLHRLLAALPDLRGLPLWKLVEPLPPSGADRRLEQARQRPARLQWLSGSRLDPQHLMRAELPDECGHLFRPAFLSPSYGVAPVLGYFEAYPHIDASQAYREYRTYLSLLSETRAGPAPRLVLKDPFHALFLDALFDALPGAMVVQTHRDPREVVPSFVKLLTSAQRMVTRHLDLPRIAHALQDWLLTLAQRSVTRISQGRHAVLDIDYRTLVADPVTTVEAVHEHFGLPFSPAWRGRLKALVDKGRQRLPAPCDATDFGLDLSDIHTTFEPYSSRFL